MAKRAAIKRVFIPLSSVWAESNAHQKLEVRERRALQAASYTRNAENPDARTLGVHIQGHSIRAEAQRFAR
jgi:hypothetical protein